MKSCKLAGISLLLAGVAAAQDLAPEVALLARIKSHIRQELSRLPNYTCLETISRFQKIPSSDPRSQLKLLDTVRLEIVYSNHREWYGSPGDRSLNVDNPVAFIGGGMIGDGAFALTLNNILEGAGLVYRGEETVGNRKTVRYDFRLARMLSGLEISIPGGSGTVGEDGSIWADPESLDLIRVESRADDIPSYLPLDESSMSVNYARMRIGEYDVMLAQQADLHMLESSGMESFDRLEFTHCRAYSAESEIHFGEEASDVPPAAPPAIPSAPDRAVPALMLVTVQLTSSISEKDTVGALIEGKVFGDVARKGKIVIPDGSTIRGRIRRLERFQGGGAFIVGLEFTEVAVGGESLLFYADLLRIDKNPQIKPSLPERVLVPDRGGVQTQEATITLPELPGVASFFVRGTTFVLPVGFRMVWRTRGPIRGN